MEEERSPCCEAFIVQNCCSDCQRLVEEPHEAYETDAQEDY